MFVGCGAERSLPFLEGVRVGEGCMVASEMMKERKERDAADG